MDFSNQQAFALRARLLLKVKGLSKTEDLLLVFFKTNKLINPFLHIQTLGMTTINLLDSDPSLYDSLKDICLVWVSIVLALMRVPSPNDRYFLYLIKNAVDLVCLMSSLDYG